MDVRRRIWVAVGRLLEEWNRRLPDWRPFAGRHEATWVQPPGGPPEVLPPLYGVARAWGIRVEWAPPDAPGVRGFYLPGLRMIRLFTYDPGTFFHELAHAAQHRLGRLGKGGPDPQEEMVAETCAAALALLYGYPQRVAYAMDYLAYWGMQPRVPSTGFLREVVRVLEAILGAAGGQRG